MTWPIRFALLRTRHCILSAVTICLTGFTVAQPVIAQHGDAAQQRNCTFLAENFRELEASLARVDLTSEQFSVLTNLQANVANLHRNHGCDPGALVDALDIVSSDRSGNNTAGAEARARGSGSNRDQGQDRRRAPPDDLVAKGRLPVRLTPDPVGEVHGVLEKGSRLPVIAGPVPDGWLAVDIGEGKTGYVLADGVIARRRALQNLRDRLQAEANTGDPDAQFQAGNVAVATDMGEAIGWWRKAARQGHPGARYNLGVAYMDGSIQPSDSGCAIALWRQSADGGHAKAAQALKRVENLIRRRKFEDTSPRPDRCPLETAAVDDGSAGGDAVGENAGPAADTEDAPVASPTPVATGSGEALQPSADSDPFPNE